MATGTGLDAQIGFGEEIHPGTAVTVATFLEFNSETHRQQPDVAGVRPVCGRWPVREAHRRGCGRPGTTCPGRSTMECATKGMSLLFKHCVASSTAAATTGTQAHAFGGTFAGKALTVQVGRPESKSTYAVKPFTYAGCKVTGWEFSCATGEGATLSVDVDGTSATTATALATASYVASSSNYVFSDVTTATLGGSSLFSGGLVVTGLSIKGSFPLATERQGLGFGKAKAEQLLIGQPDHHRHPDGGVQPGSAVRPVPRGDRDGAGGDVHQRHVHADVQHAVGEDQAGEPERGRPGDRHQMTVDLEALDDETDAPHHGHGRQLTVADFRVTGAREVERAARILKASGDKAGRKEILQDDPDGDEAAAGGAEGFRPGHPAAPRRTEPAHRRVGHLGPDPHDGHVGRCADRRHRRQEGPGHPRPPTEAGCGTRCSRTRPRPAASGRG